MSNDIPLGNGNRRSNSLMPDACALSPVSRRACMHPVSPPWADAVRLLAARSCRTMHASLRSQGGQRWSEIGAAMRGFSAGIYPTLWLLLKSRVGGKP